MPLFEVAILEKTKEKDKETREKLVFGPKAVVARNEQAAVIGAILDAKSTSTEIDIEKVEVLIRPFA